MRSKSIKKYIQLHTLFAYYSTIMVVAKFASKQEFLSISFMALFVLELVLFFTYAIMWQRIIKQFDLVSAYSQKSIVLIWTLLWSILLFNESITLNNILGVVAITIGIYVMER